MRLCHSRRAASRRSSARASPAFRDRVVDDLSPFLRDRVGELNSWDDIKLLTVAVDRLRQWHRPGLLCIGDAAHAMSPVGGVGINLAIQDAVAAANILAEPLRAGAVTAAHLAAVQARRAFPMQVIQRMQVIVQNKLLSPALASRERPKPPFVMRLIQWLPVLRPHSGADRRPWRPARAHPDAGTSLTEIFRLQFDRRAVRRAVGGVVPGVVVLPQRAASVTPFSATIRSSAASQCR